MSDYIQIWSKMTEAVISSFMQELADSRRRENVVESNYSYEKEKEESRPFIKVEEFVCPPFIEETIAGKETKVIY